MFDFCNNCNFLLDLCFEIKDNLLDIKDDSLITKKECEYLTFAEWKLLMAVSS